jgi:spermidine synthase
MIDARREPATFAALLDGAHGATFFLVGVYFAVLQFAYFFLLEVFVSSRAITYFACLFFWLIGFLVGLNYGDRFRPRTILGGGLLAYYLTVLINLFYPYKTVSLVTIGLLIAVSGVSPGYFFSQVGQHYRTVRKIFFLENNGFIAGTALCFYLAVFFGKWLLYAVPAVSLLALWLSTKIPSWTALPRLAARENTPFALTLAGLYFGILQTALFFVVQVHVTATFFGYFLILMVWMVGVILALRLPWSLSLPKALLLSCLSYYLFYATAVLWNGELWLVSCVLSLMVTVCAWPVGALLKEFSAKTSPKELFFHENNGFVLGLLLGLLLFTQWGSISLQFSPLWLLLAVTLAYYHKTLAALLTLAAGALASLLVGTLIAQAALMVLVAIATFLACYRRPRSALAAPAPAGVGVTPTVARCVLFICGLNAILLQYFITREFSNILSANELTILVVAVTYMLGFSFGYIASPMRLHIGWRCTIFAMFFVHLLVVGFSKIAAGYLIANGYGGMTVLGLLAVNAFLTSSFYAIFLPHLLRDAAQVPLATGYSLDLCGAMTATVLLVLTMQWAPAMLWVLYFVLLLALIVLVLPGERFLVPGAVIALFALGIFLASQPQLGKLVLEDYYRTRNYEHPSVVFSGNSVYHSVDVIDTHTDAARTRKRSRIALINGIRYFQADYNDRGALLQDSSSLGEFTYFLAELPAKYAAQKFARKLRVLILGGGSLSTVQRVSPYADKITVVEIDPLVVEAARAAWLELTRLDELTNYEIVVDDAKHYLRSSKETFDLIIDDVSAPYYLGTMLMHSVELYELVKTRLKPEGIFAESTQGRPDTARLQGIGMKILKGVTEVFENYRVIDARESPRGARGYVYASQGTDFQTGDLVTLMKQDDKYEGTSTYAERSPHFASLAKVDAYSLRHMESLLKENLNRLSNRLDVGDNVSAWRNRRAVWNYQTPQYLLEIAQTTWVQLGCAMLVLGGLIWCWVSKKDRTLSTPVEPTYSGLDQSS